MFVLAGGCWLVCGVYRARATHHTLFPTLTLTLTFHHPEQSLLHKLHWLDHVIRVGVFSVSRARIHKQTQLPV